MAENRSRTAIKHFEKCPDCGADVSLKTENTSEGYHYLVLYNPDESRHVCGTERRQFEKHPIGQKVTGQSVVDYQLRGRRLTITLADGNVLSVTAAGTPLTVSLEGPGGIFQE